MQVVSSSGVDLPTQARIANLSGTNLRPFDAKSRAVSVRYQKGGLKYVVF
jgi:hypothetical protein